MPVILYKGDTGLGQGDPVLADIGTGTSVPRGVESQFRYNGLIMNDKSIIDKYRIINISGLDDADVRDSREDKPADHGEWPLGAYYGGRTIAMTGRIEAFSLAKLRDMQLALRSAFADLDEKPLYFLTGDPSTEHFINCRKFSKLQWDEEQKDVNRFFRDFLITVRASDPRFYLSQIKAYTYFPNRVPNGSFEVDTTGWTASNANWSTTTFARQTGWGYDGTAALRITGTKDNNTTLRYLGAQTDITDIPVSASTDYKGKVRYNIFNKGTGGGVYISWYDADSVFISSSATSGVQDSTGEQTVAFSGTSPSNAAFAQIVVMLSSNTANDVVDYYVDDIWFINDTGIEQDIGQLHLPNQGNIYSEPTIVIYGEMKNIDFTLVPSGDNFALKDGIVVTPNTSYIINTATPSILRNDGTNKFDDMADAADWPYVQPVDNVVTSSSNSCVGLTDTARIEFIYRDSYI